MDKWRSILDQDSGMRAAWLAAFQPEILAGTCEAFFMSIAKDMTIDDKRRVCEQAKASFGQIAAENLDLDAREVALLIIRKRLNSMTPHGKWNDRWLDHPVPTTWQSRRRRSAT